MQKTFVLLAALSGLSAVALGAFGAHGLQPLLSAHQLMMWEKAVQYQFYHTGALLFCVLLAERLPAALLTWAGRCFAVGILFFSGSLYLLATRELTGLSGSILGPITPMGGLLFIAGWALLFTAGLKEGE